MARNLCAVKYIRSFLEYPDKQTCNSTTLHTHCTAKHNYRTAQHNYICFLVIRVETHPFLLQLLPMLEKSGDPYGTMYNKKTSVSDPNIRSAGGAGGYFKIRSCYGVWNLTFATKMRTCYRFCTRPTSGINCRMEKSGS